MAKFSRRQFIITAGATAAGTLFMHGCSSPSDSASSGSDAASPAPVASADAPEVTKATLGFIALTDSAPLIIAKEKGFFEKYGMPDVEVVKQASWGTTRDNIVLGSAGGGIDGAHILSPMPYLITEGIVTDGKKVPMYVLARLNTNGQAISVANAHKDLGVQMDSSTLRSKIDAAKSAGNQMKFAVTFPGGTHDLWMRYWLAAGGINPDSDVSTIVVPPPQMVANMKTGTMDAFCVGEPWNAQLINQNIGYSALTTGQLWKDHPEKAFALRADWVDQHPKAAMALLKAVLEAQVWCEENKEEMVEIVSKRAWFGVPAADIQDRTSGKYDFGDGRVEEGVPYVMKFWNDNASYPYKSHDLWFVTEDMRWGYFPADTDAQALVDKVNREDLWREAAKAIGQEAAIPASTSRGVETFFDGVTFDPENPQAYLDSLKIKKI
ncbi:ABC transporter substrate-binding protein [Oscillatoria sp. FACHB-1407]|uniref:CmpA/NrtA family ABC transporter substrate-binding protein n=1 Tax=Oscillatoria sp. FACHB-1407 TaxID=2692847 RepID=UPI001683C5E6|nr:CmpA/NrtA family ABC transporter substrate-binding protein [Oscillatoria sp. FACHB-1407]MBD2459653.1 ABC transporter substrate-binding protein [Oscillatoria sp. FACHB-1407]